MAAPFLCNGAAIAAFGDSKAKSVVGAVDIVNGALHLQVDTGGLAFRQQHVHDLARRPGTEELAAGLFVVVDAVPFDQPDEIVLGVTLQRRDAESRIAGKVMFRPGVEVGEVAAPATGNADLLARPSGVVEQQDRPSALARLDRAHQARRARADDDHIHRCRRRCHRTVPPRR